MKNEVRNCLGRPSTPSETADGSHREWIPTLGASRLPTARLCRCINHTRHHQTTRSRNARRDSTAVIAWRSATCNPAIRADLGQELLERCSVIIELKLSAITASRSRVAC